ncbi:hypoxia inducible factor 1 subunit alpha, like 2 isoform X2 [Alosa alosa]|uniref:hypoxia inducible factor 1 subunit alpha, like 2 isoform X2 n=1 Tax=Alosa alosa TaxID=278164 RepID=UPI0020154EBF|nr:hypoxia inducible factor 1 subunit alpha, like 2 isoform X2 [Alosa alosa]
MIEDYIEATLTDYLNRQLNNEKGNTEKVSEPKKQRTSTAWKRAQSCIAARGRRQRERELFNELADLLPLPPNTGAQLNKACIIRLTAGYLHVRALLGPSTFQQTQNTEDIIDVARPLPLKSIYPYYKRAIPSICLEEGLLDLALEGFLLVTFLDGRVLYTTENVNKYIAINQVDLIGRSLFDIMHPYDQNEVKQVLAKLAGSVGRQKCSLFWRTKNTVSLRAVSWTVLHCTGVKGPSHPLASHSLLLLCQPLPVQGVDHIPAGLNHKTFQSIHSPDMRFTSCDSRVWELTGFQNTELVGQSVYKYYHTIDCLKLMQSHICLLSKGRMVTGKYRLHHKHGGYVWVETEASVVYNNQTRQPQTIFCINYVLSDAELPEVVFSLEQLEYSLKSHGLCPETTVSPVLAHTAGQDTANRANGSALLSNTTGHTRLSDSPTVFNKHLCEKASVSYVSHHVFHDDKWYRDLDALAPYIPMDGEDSVLLPIQDYPWHRQESSKDCGLSGNGLDVHHYHGGKPHASECVLCSSNPAATYPVSQGQPQPHSSWTQRHKILKTDNTHTRRNLQPVWDSLSPIVQQESNAPQEHTPQNPQRVKITSVQSSQYKHPPNSRQSTSHPYPTWQRIRDREIYTGTHNSPTSMQRRSGHIRNLQRPGKRKDYAEGQVDSFSLNLPLLSHSECEVNAPLGPTFYLLSGTEITSVLDQATTRISMG